MVKPESIEALLAPSLRVSRPVAACARCRSAKIKCDGKLPACSACERSGKAGSCTSANDEFARGKERSYVAALEAAAQRLQKKIDMVHANSTTISHGSGHRPHQSRKISGVQRKEASEVDELVSDFGFLTVNATSRDFHGFSETMSFAKLLMTSATRTELPKSDMTPLPQRWMITPLIDHYLENVFVLLPFFSETDFMASVSRVYQDPPSPNTTPLLDIWYVRMVLAIAAASLSRTRDDQYDQMAIQHVSSVIDIAPYIIHPGSMAGVQALLLLVQYALVDARHFDAWYLVGMAARLLVDLGLHCDPPPEVKMSRSELDARRKVFHCTYALDRMIAMGLGRAFSFTDDSTSTVELPALQPDPQNESGAQLFLRSLQPALFLFDIRRVQSAFYQITRWSSRAQWTLQTATEYSSSIAHDIQSWYTSLPATISPKLHAYFTLEKLYSQIMIAAPNQKVPIVNMIELNKAFVFDYSVQYADQLYLVTYNDQWRSFLTYSDMCRARYVGRQFLEIMWSDFDFLLKSQHVLVDPSSAANTSPLTNCLRAINCIQKITDILDFASQRWGLSQLRDKFQQEAAVLLTRLKNRQQEYSNTSQLYPQTTHDPTQNQEGVSSQAGYSFNITQPGILPPLANMPNPSGFSGQFPSYSAQGADNSTPNAFVLPPASSSLSRRSYQFTGPGG